MRSLQIVAISAPVLVLLPMRPAQAAPPANDDLADATVIQSLPYTDVVDTSEATREPDDPTCAGGAHTVWYEFTPSADINILADTIGSDYDTTLSVYTEPPGPDTQIACSDDAYGLQSAVLFEAEANQTYYFMAGSFGDSPGGQLVFNVEEGPPPLDIDLTFDPTGTFDPHTGEATVSGTVVCSTPTTVYVDGRLEQRVLGRLLIGGYFFTEVACDGATDFSATVEPDGDGLAGLFKGGRATIEWAYAYACQEVDGLVFCDEAVVEDVGIHLRGGGQGN